MPSLRNSPLCNLLGCTVPVVLAGMGGVSRSELVAAVTEAGGFGFLGMVREPPELIACEIERLYELGHRRFGVNIIPAATDPVLLEHQVTTCIRLGVPVVGTFWDLDEWLTARLRDAGILVVHQVGSIDEALAAQRAGVDVIIAQGREAGGHVRGVRPLRELLPELASAVNVPVLAAGGISSGGDLVTAMALGAEGVVLGTAMIATHESFAHAYHKQRLLTAEADDTLLTSTFHINWPPGAPVRVLRSATTSGARGDSHTVERIVIGAEGERPIYLFSTDSPLRSMTGDFESMALYAGTGVGRIIEITPAGDRLRAIVAEAEELIAIQSETAEVAEPSSPACYAHEISGSYMGLLDDEELSAQLWMLAEDMQTALRAALFPQPMSAMPAPPFAPGTTEFGCWSLRLRLLAASLGSGLLRPSTAVPQLRLLTLDPSLLFAAMLGRLGAIIPRIPEGGVRHQLAQLVAFIETRRLAAIRTKPGALLPATRSIESHDASGR